MLALQLSPQGSLINLARRAGEDRFKVTLLNGNIRMYAVFDGHGDAAVANFLQQNLAQVLDASFTGINPDDPEQIKTRVVQGYKRIDHQMYIQKLNGGSTAGVILVTPRHIYLISLGDSRSIVYDQGKVLATSKDCTPGDSSEKLRIEKLGGFVNQTFGPRVAGYLAVSRSFGDFFLKRAEGIEGYVAEGWVTVIPEISVLIRPGQVSLLVASDGLWDAFAPAQVALVPQSPSKSETLAELAGHMTTDDITIIDDRI